MRHEISHYSIAFAKSACFFSRGPLAHGATAALFALDEIKPAESTTNKIIDGGLGACKGLLTKSVLDKLTHLNLNPAAKGVTLGTTSRVIDAALTRTNYIDARDNSFSARAAMTNILNKSLDGNALAMDALIFLAGERMLSKAMAEPGVMKSDFWKTTLGGTFFGLAAGAAAEWQQQKQNGEFNVWRIAMRASLQAGADSLGAATAWRINRGPIQVRTYKEQRRAQVLFPGEGDTIPLDSRLSLTPDQTRDVAALLRQLGSPIVVSEPSKLSPAPNVAVSSDYGVYRAALPEQVIDLHLYRPAGLPEILIPAAYDKALNQVRTLRFEANKPTSVLDPTAMNQREQSRQRLAEHPLREALLPEELIPVLEQMPTNAREVRILDRANPDDPFYAKQHSIADFKSAADASSNGDITLFRPRRTLLDHAGESSIKGLLLHEWSHLLRWENVETGRLFDKACRLEPDLLASNYNRSSGDEMWSKNLSDLLHSDANVMKATAERLPLRSLVLARALQTSLGTVETGHRLPSHSVYLERIDVIKALATERAQQLISAHMQVSRDLTQASAARLAIEMGLERAIGELKSIRQIDLTGSRLTDRVAENLAGAKVEVLKLTSTEVSSRVGETLTKLPLLNELYLNKTRVGDDIFLHLRRINSLRTVHLGDTGVSQRALDLFSTDRPDVLVW